MTKTETYISLRAEGMSLTGIANRFGITKQAVQSAIRKYGDRHVLPSTVIYPGLRKWMTEHRVFLTDLERMTGLKLRYALHNGRINTEKVDAILNVTGMSYDEAFGGELK